MIVCFCKLEVNIKKARGVNLGSVQFITEHVVADYNQARKAYAGRKMPEFSF